MSTTRLWRCALRYSLALALLAPAPAAAQGGPADSAEPAFTFVAGPRSGTGRSWAVQVVRLDARRPQLAAAFEGGLWRLAAGGALSPLPQPCPGAPRPGQEPFFADLDGDGRADAVCGDSLRPGDGRGRFGPARPLPPTIAWLYVVAHDLDGDGDLDLIVASQDTDRVLLNDGRGRFVDSGRSFGGWGQARYGFGDLNGDGRLDVFVAIPHTPPPDIGPARNRLWLGDGHGGFTEGPEPPRVRETRDVALTDFNADGAADLFLADGIGGGKLFLNDGHGVLSEAGLDFGSGHTVAVRVADFDGDGSPDLFLGAGGPMDDGPPNTVWLNDGRGRFRDSGLRLGNGNSLSAAVADLNGDGRPDVIVGNVDLQHGAMRNETWINTPLRPSRPLAFIDNGQRLNTRVSYGTTLGDFDGDGFNDVFFLNLESAEGSGDRLYRGAGDGKLNDNGQVLLDPSNAFMNPLAVDLDGDGRLEVVTGSTVWRDDGHGRMTADTTAFGVRRGMVPVGIADLDGDGRLDYLALMIGRSASARVLLNPGAGPFRDSGQRFGSGSLGPGAVGDLDGDGDVDAVLGGWRDQPTDSVPNRVWLNDGRGNFTWSGEAFDEGMRHVHAIALADVDRDGDLDLLVGTQSPPFLTLYLNRGDGRFLRPGRTYGAAGVERIALADLDGDGDLDMILACHGPNEVWQNDGRGNFTDSGLRLGTEWSWGLAVGDLDGDGRPDLVFGNMAVEQRGNQYVRHGPPAEVWLNRTSPTGSRQTP